MSLMSIKVKQDGIQSEKNQCEDKRVVQRAESNTMVGEVVQRAESNTMVGEAVQRAESNTMVGEVVQRAESNTMVGEVIRPVWKGLQMRFLPCEWKEKMNGRCSVDVVIPEVARVVQALVATKKGRSMVLKWMNEVVMDDESDSDVEMPASKIIKIEAPKSGKEEMLSASNEQPTVSTTQNQEENNVPTVVNEPENSNRAKRKRSARRRLTKARFRNTNSDCSDDISNKRDTYTRVTRSSTNVPSSSNATEKDKKSIPSKDEKDDASLDFLDVDVLEVDVLEIEKYSAVEKFPTHNTTPVKSPWFSRPLTACWICKLQLSTIRGLRQHFRDYKHNGKFNSFHLSTWAKLTFAFLQKASEHLKLSSLEELHVKVESKFEGSEEVTSWTDELIFWFFCATEEKDSHGVKQLISERGALAVMKTVNPSFRATLLQIDDKIQLKCIPSMDQFPRVVWDAHCNIDLWHEHNRNTATSQIINIGNFNAITSYSWPEHWHRSNDESWWPKEKGSLYRTFGIHPYETENIVWIPSLKKRLLTYLGGSSCVGIGEVGLSWCPRSSSSYLMAQEKVLGHMAEIARELNLPMVVHCQGGIEIHKRCITILKQHLHRNHPLQLQSFMSDIEVASVWSDAFSTLLFSIPPEILLGKAYETELFIEECSLGRLVVESAAPCPPGASSPFRSINVAEYIAKLKGVPFELIWGVFARNIIKFFDS